jgi:hypothetical protein
MGVRCGSARVTHANGSVFSGSYDSDVACGEGSFAYPGGDVEVKGSWLQGQLHGEVRCLRLFHCGMFRVFSLAFIYRR